MALVLLGGALSLGTFIAGVSAAADRTTSACSGRTGFGQDDQKVCYTHPHLAEGLGLVCAALALAVLLLVATRLLLTVTSAKQSPMVVEEGSGT